jgi:arabinose-5-phosphate isomerase
MSIDERISFARSFINSQLDALLKVRDLLSVSFSESVELIMTRRGRLVCVGLGKAGYIASKCSATFSSVGVSSYYVHPAELPHGDFGRLCNDDIVLVFSHGGETREICRLLHFTSINDIKSILITSSNESTSARLADFVIHYGNIAEAGLHGIAPTTSATVMLILGDALALACASGSGMTTGDFARNHPGGSLGKLLISIDDVMRTGDRVCIVNEMERTFDVVVKYQNTRDRPGAAIVVDDDGGLVGVFTDGNLRRLVAKGEPFYDLPIKSTMTANPIVVVAKQNIGEVCDTLTARKIDQVIVVDSEDKPLGLIDIQDIIHIM